MQKLYNLILFLCLALSSMGQTHSSADRLFTDGNYTSAQDQYGKLLRSYPTNALYLYRYARCAQELGDHDTAIEYFQKAGDR
jgi:tetratricopeptide (TPR) repeat protein